MNLLGALFQSESVEEPTMHSVSSESKMIVDCTELVGAVVHS